MILTDSQIRNAIESGHLIVDPPPSDDQYGPTSLDLHVGSDFRRFKPDLSNTRGMHVSILLDEISIPDLAPHMESIPSETDGTVILGPDELIIVTTRERIELPPHGKIAARIEGRSRFARLGLAIHMTAPTIHNSFRGNIVLEIMNHGPLPLRVRPNITMLCQLIFERVDEEPGRQLESPFQDQDNPLGTSDQ